MYGMQELYQFWMEAQEQKAAAEAAAKELLEQEALDYRNQHDILVLEQKQKNQEQAFIDFNKYYEESISILNNSIGNYVITINGINRNVSERLFYLQNKIDEKIRALDYYTVLSSASNIAIIEVKQFDRFFNNITGWQEPTNYLTTLYTNTEIIHENLYFNSGTQQDITIDSTSFGYTQRHYDVYIHGTNNLITSTPKVIPGNGTQTAAIEVEKFQNELYFSHSAIVDYNLKYSELLSEAFSIDDQNFETNKTTLDLQSQIEQINTNFENTDIGSLVIRINDIEDEIYQTNPTTQLIDKTLPNKIEIEKDETIDGTLANKIKDVNDDLQNQKDETIDGTLANKIKDVNDDLQNQKDETIDGTLANKIKDVNDDLQNQKDETIDGTLANKIKDVNDELDIEKNINEPGSLRQLIDEVDIKIEYEKDIDSPGSLRQQIEWNKNLLNRLINPVKNESTIDTFEIAGKRIFFKQFINKLSPEDILGLDDKLNFLQNSNTEIKTDLNEKATKTELLNLKLQIGTLEDFEAGFNSGLNGTSGGSGSGEIPPETLTDMDSIINNILGQ